MNRLSDIRIHTLYKIFPKEETISIKGVALVLNHIVVTDESGNMYDLGKDLSPSIAPVEPTPPEEQEPACNVPGTNVLATLLRGVDGVDGVTPDMSDYYDKNVVDAKLATKQNVISDISTIRENASKGATAVQPSQLANVATSGSYSDLSNRPSIPNESTVAGWGFTKNAGTYTKPNGGIPKSDLEKGVRDSLSKADSALQSVPAEYVTETELQSKGYASQSVVDNKVDKIQKDLDEKQGQLESGINIKTVFGKSIVGSGEAFSDDTIPESYIPDSIARKSEISSQATIKRVVGDDIPQELQSDVYYEFAERNALTLPNLVGDSNSLYKRWMVSVNLPNINKLTIPFKVIWRNNEKPQAPEYSILEMIFSKNAKGQIFGEWKSYYLSEYLRVMPQYLWLTSRSDYSGRYEVKSNTEWRIK